MIALTVILSTAIVVYICKLGAFKRVPIATLDFEAYGMGGDYVLAVSNLCGDTLNTGELMVRLRGADAEAVWDVPELAPEQGAEATLGVYLYLGDEVAIVHEPSGYVYRSKILTEIRAVAPTTLAVSPSSFVITSVETADLTATLSSGGNPVAGKLVTWSASVGEVRPSRCTTNSSGLVSTTYTPPETGVQTWVTITASFAGDPNYFRSSDKSSGAVLPSAGPTEEFVITADRVVMTGWSMEGPIDLGSPMVTKIIAQRQELENLYQSGFEIHADSFTATDSIVYATYVRGTEKISGVTLAWTGDQPVPLAIGLLPRDRVEIENVYLHVVRVEANTMELKNLRMVPHAFSTFERIRLEGWWWEKAYFQGEKVIKQTSENFELEDFVMANGMQTVTSLKGRNLVAYISVIWVHLSPSWWEDFYPDDLATYSQQKWLYDWLGDPYDLRYEIELCNLVAMEASDLIINDFACTVVQNDMGTGGDAGNSFEDATSITVPKGIGEWHGYLGSFDTEDYYKFSVSSGSTIKSTLEPPAGADFDLYLYGPDWDEIGRSTQKGSVIESIKSTAATSGYYYVRVSMYSGYGSYSLSIA